MNRALTLILLAGLVGLSAGCETTQEKSAKLELAGAGLAQPEKIDIGAANRDIEIVGKTLLTDEYGTAVVVRLRNTGTQPQIDVPIQIDVRDRKGKSIYRNDTEGLEEGLLRVQVVEPDQETWWVHDQVFPNGKPNSVEVTIGRSEAKAPVSIPELTATKPEVNVDPVSGVEVQGEIINRSKIEQTDTLVYAVATRGADVVAAGRGLIPKLKTGGKGEPYNVFFIGNPKGADIEVFATPNTLE